MTNHPETRFPLITVMTCRDAGVIFSVFEAAAHDNRRHLPSGVAAPEDVIAIMRGGMAFFVAYAGTEPVGAIGYRWERGTLKIFHVAVVASHQRLGVGRRLVQGVEAVGFALGSTNISVEVREDLCQLLPFERFGYKPSVAQVRNGGSMHMTKALQAPVR